jgi:hypothetical protein
MRRPRGGFRTASLHFIRKIIIRYLSGIVIYRGVKGAAPLALPPSSLGREGVTLLMAREHYGNFSKNRDLS